MLKKLFYIFVLLIFGAIGLYAQCLTGGTLLFKEDFGGNNPSDPTFTTTPLADSLVDHEYIKFNADGNPCRTRWILTNYGSYAVRKYGYELNQQWWGCVAPKDNKDYHYPFSDHTYPNDTSRGYLMQIDGANNAGTFYQCQVNDICAGSQLTFSIWAVNSSVASLWGNVELSITIYNLQNETLATLPIIIPYNNPNWQQFAVSFHTLTDQTALVFKIEDLKGGHSGNDFMLDDIEVRLCTPPVSITCSPDTLVSRSVTLSLDFENDGTFNEPLDYAWLYSPNPNAPISNWQSVSYDDSLAIYPLTFNNEGYYKLIVASQGNTASPNCRAVSDTTIHLVKKPVVHIDTTLTGCVPVTFHDSILWNTGSYTIDLIDTVYHLNFTAYRNKHNTAILRACDSIYWHDKWFYESGTYIDTLQTIHGCDSVFETQFIIYHSQHTLETLTACDSAFWHGVYYYQSGIYTDTMQAISGCDSIVTLQLNIHKAIHSTESITACDSAYWQTRWLTESGIYTDTLTTIHGCDSILTLHLTIHDCTTPPDPSEPPIDDPEQPTCDSTLIFQRWNDVLAIKNAEYNGGIYITDCQWFRNGQAIDSHPCSKTMIFVPDGLNPTDCYEAELHTTEGDTIRTCCFYPFDGFAPENQTVKPSVKPNPCHKNETITLPFTARYSLYTLNGLLIQQGQASTLLAPQQAGIYLLQIEQTHTLLIVQP